MNAKRFLAAIAVMLVVVMCMTTVGMCVPLTPPSNAKVKVLDSSSVKKAASKGWEIWDVQGSSGTSAYTEGAGQNGAGAMHITGGTVPYIFLDMNITTCDEIVFTIKSTADTSIQFQERKTKVKASSLAIPSTNNTWKDVAFTPSELKANGISDDDFAKLKSVYDAEAGSPPYSSILECFINSQDAYIEKITLNKYSYTSESSEVRDSLKTPADFKGFSMFGKWTGAGNAYIPASVDVIPDFVPAADKEAAVASTSGWIFANMVEGAGENGGKALCMTGGNTGSGSYGGAQFCMPTSFNLSGIDALKVRYKSTKGTNVSFNAGFDVYPGATIPEKWATLLGDKYPENGVVVERVKADKITNKANLPSTSGEWKDAIIPIASFGVDKYPFLRTDLCSAQHYNVGTGKTSFIPAMCLRFEGLNMGSNYLIIDNVEGIWYEKRPTMDSISFTNSGAETTYLDAGTTTTNIVLSNPASVDISSAVLVVALYDVATGKLADINVWSGTVPALGSTEEIALPVTMPGNADAFDYDLKVMLWEKDSLNQITNLAHIDAFGYEAE